MPEMLLRSRAVDVSTPPQIKILVTEPIAESGLALLREHHTLVMAKGLDKPSLLREIVDADALVIRSATKVDEEVLTAASRLKVVGRAGMGVDNVDLDAATRMGILVVNAPTSNSISAAEHTMALILAQARNIPRADASLRSKKWERAKLGGVELYRKTLGILGFGRIGILVAERAAAFGMQLVAYDPYARPEAAQKIQVELLDSVEDVLGRSDFVTLHLPLTPETKGLINAKTISSMRDGARLVNVSRGAVVVEEDLAEAIQSGKLAGAAIDVFATEPCTDSPLFSLSDAVVTPHLGASTTEAQDRAGMVVAEQILAALDGNFVPYAVNVDIGKQVSEEVRDFMPVAESLGSFFASYASGVSDSIEILVAGTLAEHDTRALVLSALKGIFSHALEEPVTFVNVRDIAKRRGVKIREVSSSNAQEYVSLLGISGLVGGKTLEVSGTLDPTRGEPRVIQVNEYDIDICPSAHMAMIVNDDRPGVIGHVGMALGDAGVNIANMIVGRHVGDPLAMMGLNLDQPVPTEVMEALRSSPGVLDAKFLHLSSLRESQPDV